MADRVRILYFSTDRLCKFLVKKVQKNVTITIDGRTYNLLTATPNIIEAGNLFSSKSKPFYIIKHNVNQPIEMITVPKSKTSPEEINQIMNLETLKSLLKIEKKIPKLPLIILMIVLFVAGFGLAFALAIIKVI